MKNALYAIKDDMTDFSSPVALMARSDEELAKRYFRRMCQTTQIMIGNEDQFSLYKVGLYDTETGEIESINPIFIERGVKTNVNTIQNERENNSNKNTGRE